ncbi:MAG TPA: hypothetical protein VFL94_10735, partial [Actinomycetales bacterium]|nr:hypothetical protein [Actinomycetales bacterium]
MSEQHSGAVGPREDEELAHETQGLVKGGHSTRAEEWRDPEPLDENTATGQRGMVTGDEGGTPAGMDQADVKMRSEIARFLDGNALPGNRESLIRSAEEHYAPDPVMRLLAS